MNRFYGLNQSVNNSFFEILYLLTIMMTIIVIIVIIMIILVTIIIIIIIMFFFDKATNLKIFLFLNLPLTPTMYSKQH